jgi:hypothetical protein
VSAFSRNLVRITPERCPLCVGTGVRFPPDYAITRASSRAPKKSATFVEQAWDTGPLTFHLALAPRLNNYDALDVGSDPDTTWLTRW